MSNLEFPKSLEDIRRPTLEEVEAAVDAGLRIIKALAKARAGKILRTDPEMDKTVVRWFGYYSPRTGHIRFGPTYGEHSFNGVPSDARPIEEFLQRNDNTK